MGRGEGLDLGLVVAAHGRHVIVETPEGRRVLCHPRGKKSELVVGDRVRWLPLGEGADAEGVIEHLEPRRNLLFRQDEMRTKAFAANSCGNDIPANESPPILRKSRRRRPWQSRLGRGSQTVSMKNSGKAGGDGVGGGRGVLKRIDKGRWYAAKGM